MPGWDQMECKPFSHYLYLLFFPPPCLSLFYFLDISPPPLLFSVVFCPVLHLPISPILLLSRRCVLLPIPAPSGRRNCDSECSDGEEDFYYTEIKLNTDSVADGLSSLSPVSPSVLSPPTAPGPRRQWQRQRKGREQHHAPQPLRPQHALPSSTLTTPTR